MTKLLEKAFAEASKLPVEDQGRFARLMLSELESEAKWTELFAKSGDLLDRMGEEALAEHKAGLTKPLDETLDVKDK